MQCDVPFRDRILEQSTPAAGCPTAGALRERALRILFGDDDEDGVGVCEVEVSILCPYSRLPIRNAVRSSECNHVPCADLDSWAQALEKGKAMKDPKAVCPVCGEWRRLSTLHIDRWMQHLITHALPGTQIIIIHADGTVTEKELGGPLARRGARVEEVDLLTQSPSQGDGGSSPVHMTRYGGIKAEPGTYTAVNPFGPSSSLLKVEQHAVVVRRVLPLPESSDEDVIEEVASIGGGPPAAGYRTDPCPQNGIDTQHHNPHLHTSAMMSATADDNYEGDALEVTGEVTGRFSDPLPPPAVAVASMQITAPDGASQPITPMTVSSTSGGGWMTKVETSSEGFDRQTLPAHWKPFCGRCSMICLPVEVGGRGGVVDGENPPSEEFTCCQRTAPRLAWPLTYGVGSVGLMCTVDGFLIVIGNAVDKFGARLTAAGFHRGPEAAAIYFGKLPESFGRFEMDYLLAVCQLASRPGSTPADCYAVFPTPTLFRSDPPRRLQQAGGPFGSSQPWVAPTPLLSIPSPPEHPPSQSPHPPHPHQSNSSQHLSVRW